MASADNPNNPNNNQPQPTAADDAELFAKLSLLYDAPEPPKKDPKTSTYVMQKRLKDLKSSDTDKETNEKYSNLSNDEIVNRAKALRSGDNTNNNNNNTSNTNNNISNPNPNPMGFYSNMENNPTLTDPNALMQSLNEEINLERGTYNMNQNQNFNNINNISNINNNNGMSNISGVNTNANMQYAMSDSNAFMASLAGSTQNPYNANSMAQSNVNNMIQESNDLLSQVPTHLRSKKKPTAADNEEYNDYNNNDNNNSNNNMGLSSYGNSKQSAKQTKKELKKLANKRNNNNNFGMDDSGSDSDGGGDDRWKALVAQVEEEQRLGIEPTNDTNNNKNNNNNKNSNATQSKKTGNSKNVDNDEWDSYADYDTGNKPKGNQNGRMFGRLFGQKRRK